MSTKPRTLCLAVVAFLGLGLHANAAEDKYGITSAEHAACDTDVESLCVDQVQSEDQVIECMKAKRAQLTPVCKTSFEAGMRKRHLPL